MRAGDWVGVASSPGRGGACTAATCSTILTISQSPLYISLLARFVILASRQSHQVSLRRERFGDEVCPCGASLCVFFAQKSVEGGVIFRCRWGGCIGSVVPLTQVEFGVQASLCRCWMSGEPVQWSRRYYSFVFVERHWVEEGGGGGRG